MNKARISIVLFLALLTGAPAVAQYSKMQDAMSNIRRHSDALRELQGRDPFDVARAAATARQLQNACVTAVGVFSNFGEVLALESLSSSDKDRLREPFTLAFQITNAIDDLRGKCEDLLKLTSSGSPEQIKAATGSVGTHYVDRGQRDLENLRRKSEEIMRWLRESYQTTLAMREDAAKPGAALDAARRQIETKQHEQNQEVQRCFNTWFGCSTREQDAVKRFTDSRGEYDSARQAPPSSSSASNVESAWRKWFAAGRERKEAARLTYDALAQLQTAAAEARSRLIELSRLISDLEKFQESANPETISRRIFDFDRWTKIFERELSR